MPRDISIGKKGIIGLPPDVLHGSWKVIITDSNSTEHDVTDYLTSGTINMIATAGLSNFTITLDNTDGRYKGVFAPRNTVDFYYGYKEKADLSTIKMRGYIDNIFSSFDSDGFTLIVEGRDSPISSTNEHFADTHISIQFVTMNNIDCWFGTEGDTDSNSNYEDGILYNSGMILRIYDTADNTWKNWKDLSEEQRQIIRDQTGYTQTHTNTYVEKSRLAMSERVAEEGDFDFRIWYDSGNTYFMVHPEEAIENSEHITAGQNLISMDKYGANTLEEYNRFKEKGAVDGPLLTMRTKQDTDRQAIIWIKDKEETTSSLKKDTEIAERAAARLNELKEALAKGRLTCVGVSSLHPAEKIAVNVPYIVNAKVKVKSFTVTFGTDLEFTLDLQDRETRFERIFKDRQDENLDLTPSDNPKDMRNSILYDFSNLTDYSLDGDCEITSDQILTLKSGSASGYMITTAHTADQNVTHIIIRTLANQTIKCEYKVSNNNGTTWEPASGSYGLGSLHEFTSTGKKIKFKIHLVEKATNASPEFQKFVIMYKP